MHRTRSYLIVSTRYDVAGVSGHSFSLEPGADILREGKIAYRIYIDRDLKMWRYRRDIVDCTRFLLLHEHVEKACLEAIKAGGREADRLMMALSMTGPDDLYVHAHGMATAAELFAVRTAFGDQGLRAYRDFMLTQVKSDKQIKL